MSRIELLKTNRSLVNTQHKRKIVRLPLLIHVNIVTLYIEADMVYYVLISVRV